MQVITLDQLKKYFSINRKQIFDDFFHFLRFPTIASDPKHQEDVRACADWLKKELEAINLKVSVWELENQAPVIFAENLDAGANKPTLLIYNHYDVQPVDPLEEWLSPPFEPTIREGEIYARGAVDDKGQCFYVLQALKALNEELESYPVNIKFLIEGGEESGSVALSHFLKIKQKELKADYAIIVDTGMQNKTDPAITLGVRGIVTFDLSLTGSSHDLHSGQHGGIAYNPNRALCELLSNLIDSSGKVTIAGFYDAIEPISENEKADIDWDFDEEQYESQFKIKACGGEKQFSFLERNWLRPTLEINGICGGYSGPGFKTVIPAKASAKISCRLVPKQEPAKMIELLKNYFLSKIPDGMKMDIFFHPGSGPAMRTTPYSKIAIAASRAFSEIYEKKCKHLLIGGSIPIISDLITTSEAEMVLMGLCLPDDQTHAPNEHFGEDRIEMGFLVVATLIQNLANL